MDISFLRTKACSYRRGIWYALEESAFGMKECRNSVDTRTGK